MSSLSVSSTESSANLKAIFGKSSFPAQSVGSSNLIRCARCGHELYSVLTSGLFGSCKAGLLVASRFELVQEIPEARSHQPSRASACLAALSFLNIIEVNFSVHICHASKRSFGLSKSRRESDERK